MLSSGVPRRAGSARGVHRRGDPPIRAHAEGHRGRSGPSRTRRAGAGQAPQTGGCRGCWRIGGLRGRLLTASRPEPKAAGNQPERIGARRGEPAAQRALCLLGRGFDSQQLHQEDAGQSQRLWPVYFSSAVADDLPAESIVIGALDKVVLVNCRLAIGLLAALAAVLAVPTQGHADPPTKCLSNTPKGKQVYVPCDLLNAGVNFPPGQRCPPPLEQYPKDVQDWCGEGPGLASPTPSSPISPTGPTSPAQPTSPVSPTSPATPTTTKTPTPTTTTTPTTSTTPTTPTGAMSSTNPTAPTSR